MEGLLSTGPTPSRFYLFYLVTMKKQVFFCVMVSDRLANTFNFYVQVSLKKKKKLSTLIHVNIENTIRCMWDKSPLHCRFNPYILFLKVHFMHKLILKGYRKLNYIFKKTLT